MDALTQKMMSITTNTLGVMHLEMRQQQQSSISPSVFTVQCSLFSCFILHATNSFHFCSSRHLITTFFCSSLVSVYRRHRCCCLCMQGLPSFLLLLCSHCVFARKFISVQSFLHRLFRTTALAFSLSGQIVCN